MNGDLQEVLRAIIKEELEPIKEDINEFRKEINDFKLMTNEGFKVLNEQVEALNQKVDKRFDATGEVITDVMYGTRELSEKVDVLAGQYGKVETNINVLSNKFNKTIRLQ